MSNPMQQEVSICDQRNLKTLKQFLQIRLPSGVVWNKLPQNRKNCLDDEDEIVNIQKQ